MRKQVRYPGLTVVGTIGMAVAMAIASGAFAIIGAMLSPSIPLDEGDRVVSIAGREEKAAVIAVVLDLERFVARRTEAWAN